MLNELITTWLHGDRNYADGLQLLQSMQPGSLIVLILEAGEDEYNQNLLVEELTKLNGLNADIFSTNNDFPSRVLKSLNANVSQALNQPGTGDIDKAGWIIDTLPDNADAQFFDAFDQAYILSALGIPSEYFSERKPRTEAGSTEEVNPRNTSADTNKRINLKKEAGQLWQEMAHTKGSMALLRSGKALHRQARSLLQLNEKRQRIWDEIDFFDENGYWHGEKTVAVDKPVNLEQLIKNQMTYRTKAEKELALPLINSKREYLEGRVAKFNAEIDRLKALREVAA
jgi:hypothetical protein